MVVMLNHHPKTQPSEAGKGNKVFPMCKIASTCVNKK